MELPDDSVQLMKYAPICSKEGDGVCQGAFACGRKGMVLILFFFLLIIKYTAGGVVEIDSRKRGPQHGVLKLESKEPKLGNEAPRIPEKAFPKLKNEALFLSSKGFFVIGLLSDVKLINSARFVFGTCALIMGVSSQALNFTD